MKCYEGYEVKCVLKWKYADYNMIYITHEDVYKSSGS
jgi:hypothetical protein